MAEPDRITAHAHVTTHVADGLAAVMRALRNAANLKAISAAWLAQVQALEDVLWDLLLQADLTYAVGAQLDQIGVIVGMPRGTLDDTDFRPILRAAIRARRSSGGTEDLIAIATLALTGSGVTFSVREGHGSVVIEPHATIPLDAAALLRVLRLGKAGGGQVQLFTPPFLEAGLFTLAPAGSLLVTTDANRGLGADAGGTGGHLTGVVG